MGKKCQLKSKGEYLLDVEVAAPPSSGTLLCKHILLQLQQLGDKMDSINKRVQHTEASMGQDNSQVCQILSNFSVKNADYMVLHGRIMEDVNSKKLVN